MMDARQIGRLLGGLQGDERERTPEERLFLAVIVQAIMDSGIHPTIGQQDSIRHKADVWIRSRPEGFLLVCELAGVHPDAVTKARKDYLSGQGGLFEDGRLRRKRLR